MSVQALHHHAKPFARLSRKPFVRLNKAFKIYILQALLKLHFCQYLCNHEGKKYNSCVSKSALIFANGVVMEHQFLETFLSWSGNTEPCDGWTDAVSTNEKAQFGPN